MEAATGTQAEYLAAISQVIAYVQTSLDEPITPRQLANVAGFSQHHFHRIFRAYVGESVMDFVRRVRLERAAYRLQNGDLGIAEIAIDAGYGSGEAFSRVFQAYFGLAPSNYRVGSRAYRLPAVSGIHFSPHGMAPLRQPVEPEMLEPSSLCEAHRRHAEAFQSHWEEALEVLMGFANLTYGGILKQGTNMTETHTEIDREIEALQQEVDAAKQRLTEARRRRPKEQVQDYVFKDFEGKEVRLSELFGDKDDLIVIHNMGTGCSSCTMWADGFNALEPHLADRAAFVLTSPDKPEVQKRFAAKRNWRFRMLSTDGNTFPMDMGFWQTEPPYPGPWPGVSTFRREADGTVVRIAKAEFGPDDDFCATWPLLDLLEGGAKGWDPKFEY